MHELAPYLASRSRPPLSHYARRRSVMTAVAGDNLARTSHHSHRVMRRRLLIRDKVLETLSHCCNPHERAV